MIPDMSDTKGNHVSITTFVGAYHAHYLEYRWSVTRVIVFYQQNPNTVEQYVAE